jgi:orotate phosphoribosyltransferase-like protein
MMLLENNISVIQTRASSEVLIIDDVMSSQRAALEVVQELEKLSGRD